jgi:hypothetical protein
LKLSFFLIALNFNEKLDPFSLIPSPLTNYQMIERNDNADKEDNIDIRNQTNSQKHFSEMEMTIENV